MSSLALTILCVAVGLLVVGWLLDLVVETLNLKHADPEIPGEFRDVYDAEKYATSQRYLRERTRFGLISATVSLVLTLAFILLGGFGWVDRFVEGLLVSGWVAGTIPRALLYAGLLVLLSMIVGLPFSIYSTFVIEEKYGFNKTTPKTFILDLIKSLGLGVVLGAPVFAAVLWIFMSVPLAWLWAWIALTLIQLFFMYIGPVVIMPLFNKFEPLEEGELQTEIRNYANEQGFEVSGIFSVDGSKRSTKANAYFTGFGKTRRIGLFDTLIENHSVTELVAVLAHEIGHCKLHHIKKMLVIGIASTGLMFFILGLFLRTPALYEAFGVVFAENKIYIGMMLFGFLFSPISTLIGLVQIWFTRKHEFEADAFAATTTGQTQPMIDALKKLTVDNLGNLTPHPLKVFLEYTHPPVLKRIDALRNLKV